MVSSPIRADRDIQVVRGLTFVAPKADGFGVYALIEDRWQCYDWKDSIEDATRIARKVAGRLRRAQEAWNRCG